MFPACCFSQRTYVAQGFFNGVLCETWTRSYFQSKWPLVGQAGLYRGVTFSQMQKIRNTDDSRCSGTKRLFTSWLLVFRHEERETIFTLLTVSTSPTVNSPARLAGLESNLNWRLFQKSPKISAPRFRTWCHSHPSQISYLGLLFWHLWLSYPLHASVNCTQCVHLHLH